MVCSPLVSKFSVINYKGFSAIHPLLLFAKYNWSERIRKSFKHPELLQSVCRDQSQLVLKDCHRRTWKSMKNFCLPLLSGTSIFPIINFSIIYTAIYRKTVVEKINTKFQNISEYSLRGIFRNVCYNFYILIVPFLQRKEKMYKHLPVFTCVELTAATSYHFRFQIHICNKTKFNTYWSWLVLPNFLCNV